MMSRLRSIAHFLRFHTLHLRSRRHIRAWQDARVEQIVSHAQQNIALYRDVYANVDYLAVHGVDNLPQLPIVKKATFLGRTIQDFTDARYFPLPPGAWSHTSGTSGVPFSVLRGTRVGMPRYSESLRYRFLFSKKPWRLDVSWARVARIKVHAAPERALLSISVRDFLDDERATLSRLAAFDPHVIESYTSILLALAAQVKEQGRPETFRPRYAVSFGEVMTPQARAFVESVLGCEVYDRYGFEEVGPTATECTTHDGMHVHSESLVVEVVDDDGRPVPEGVKGRIVVTDLFNKRMPFIRYDSGDQGMMRSDPCPCGEETPRIWVEGRHAAYLVFNDKRIHHLEFDAALDMFTNAILQYQVVKRSSEEVIVRIVPGPLFEHELIRDIVRNVSRLVGDGIGVSVEETARIPLTPRGKCRIVVDETV